MLFFHHNIEIAGKARGGRRQTGQKISRTLKQDDVYAEAGERPRDTIDFETNISLVSAHELFGVNQLAPRGRWHIGTATGIGNELFDLRGHTGSARPCQQFRPFADICRLKPVRMPQRLYQAVVMKPLR
jgi:hypothetical protein